MAALSISMRSVCYCLHTGSLQRQSAVVAGLCNRTASFRRHQVSYSSESTKLCQGASTERFLEGRVALVTGSTSGIGLGAARSLAARGCHIILNGFGDEQLIKSLQDEFTNEFNVKSEYIYADMTKTSDIEQFCQTIKSNHKNGIDILVNNAGFQHVSRAEEFPVEKWDALIAVLLSAPFHLIRLLLPDMRKRGWGRIINLASVHSVRASPFKAGYVSAKHGLAGLTKVVALETAGSGVTCNALSPGFVDTPILKMQVQALADTENLTYDEAKSKFLSSFHPSKEAVGIDHLGEMCTFLCSSAASQITGSNFVMDGGWTAK